MRPTQDVAEAVTVRCPDCGGTMHDMGMDFEAPRRDDARQWWKVEVLFVHGVTFHSCGCGPGLRPVALREVGAFLHDTLPQSEGERLLERFAGRQQRSDPKLRWRAGGMAPRITGRRWGPVFPPRRPSARKRAVETMSASGFVKPARKRAGG
jgi:hypothetical protein